MREVCMCCRKEIVGRSFKRINGAMFCLKCLDNKDKLNEILRIAYQNDGYIDLANIDRKYYFINCFLEHMQFDLSLENDVFVLSNEDGDIIEQTLIIENMLELIVDRIIIYYEDEIKNECLDENDVYVEAINYRYQFLEFYFDVAKNYIIIKNNEKEILNCIGLMDCWEFKSWVKKWLDERNINSVEYKIYLQIH